MRHPAFAVRLALVPLSLLGAGCADPVEPARPPDPVPTVSAMTDADAILRASLLQTYIALAPQMAVARGSGTVFGDTLFGKTLEWSPADARYLEGARAGAPAGAVRFLLYRPDATTNANPTYPLVEVGITDQIATTSRGAPALHTVLRDSAGALPAGDYVVGGSFGTEAYTVTLDGTIRQAVAGTVHMTLDVAPTITQALITVAVPQRDVAVRSFHSDVVAGDTLFGSLDFRVTHGGHTVSMIGTFVLTHVAAARPDEMLDLTFRDGSVTFATMRGTADAPQILDGDGAAVSSGAAFAISRLLGAPDRYFTSVTRMAQPDFALLRGY
jgi:hypothetical protein